eukprot:TRINITY_DN35939_c0_g1_i1.p1 TRINITY_DN35939_c0_g1~~TRINITY_DN35939_c0_g1_i1.p1  ORF type:complete len:634 (-),score=109.69 TRINITY_DN35939_c0_g1_i1:75-1976(-)
MLVAHQRKIALSRQNRALTCRSGVLAATAAAIYSAGSAGVLSTGLRHSSSLREAFVPLSRPTLIAWRPTNRVRSAVTAAYSDVQDLTPFQLQHREEWLSGRVKQKASYGIWVEVPSAEGGQIALGLVHLTELDKRVQIPKPGDEIRVRVVSVDVERGHLALSMKGQGEADVSKDPTIEEALDSKDPNDLSSFSNVFACVWLEGHVSNSLNAISDRGVLVEVISPNGVTAEGLVPLDQIDGATAPNANVASWFHAGQKVHTRLRRGLSLSKDGLLQLSMLGGAADIQADLEAQLHALQQKPASAEESSGNLRKEVDQRGTATSTADISLDGPLPDTQDVSSFLRLSSSDWLDGIVHHRASFGIYVTVYPSKGEGPAAWGLVHLSELPKDLADLSKLPPSTPVKVRLLNVDVESNRLLLSMVEVGTTGSSQRVVADGGDAFRSQDAATWVTGHVSEITPYGLVVKLPGTTRSGLVYSTELDRYHEDLSDSFVVGQSIQVRVVDVDGEPGGFIGLSMSSNAARMQADVEAQAHQGVSQAPIESTNEDLDATALELKAMRDSLRAFLDVSPDRLLSGLVQQDTPFGVLVIVEHPDGGQPVRGLLSKEEASELRFGDAVGVRIASVDTHRGVLSLTTS